MNPLKLFLVFLNIIIIELYVYIKVIFLNFYTTTL